MSKNITTRDELLAVSFTTPPDVLAKSYDYVTSGIWAVIWGYTQTPNDNGTCDNICRQSKPAIAKKMGISYSTLKRKLPVLIEDGWIIDLTPNKNGTHDLALSEKSYTHLIRFDDGDSSQNEDEEAPPDMGGGQNEPLRGGQNEPLNMGEGQNEPLRGGQNEPLNMGGGQNEPLNMGEGQNEPLRGGQNEPLRGGQNEPLEVPCIKDSFKDSIKDSIKSSSSSSSSSSRTKTFDDDDDDDDEATKNTKKISALLKAAGVSTKNQKAVLKIPRGIQVTDVLAELAWCHNSRVSNVSKPYVIAPMNLLKGDFPDATCYSGAYWERHIPDAILSKAGLAKYVRDEASKEQGADEDQDYQAEDSGSNNADVQRPNIPDKHWQFWQASKGQLRLEMPKANFDAWVRDIQLISTEDNVFTFAVKNSYAKDWLASRIKNSLNRLLTGSLGQETQSIFVVETK